MNKLLSLFFVVLLFLSFSCSDKEEGDVEGIIFTVRPIQPTLYKNQGDVVEFSFSINSEEKIQTVSIYRRTKKQLFSERDTVFRETPNATSFNGRYDFKYKLPADGSESETYTFEVVNVLNEKDDQYRVVFPIGVLQSLDVQLKSSISSTNNGGFDLINKKVIATDTSIATLAFYDATDTLNNSNGTLSKLWKGVNGTEFVKSNTFNFSSATAGSVKSAFESSVSSAQIGDIKANDIILIKYKVSATQFAFAAVSINNVTDLSGSEEDVYNFVLKAN